jgi:GAF domain-containing protein
VFVSEFVEGRRVFRFVNAAEPEGTIQAGESDPLEQSFCKFVVEGRLPECIPDMTALPPIPRLPEPRVPVGAHISAPIVLTDGSIYGTLCCFSASPNPALQSRDLTQLRLCAELVAHRIQRTAAGSEAASRSASPVALCC